MKSHIWWIRRDIRLQDNSALNAAQSNTDSLIPLFIIEPELMANAAPTRKAFLINALTDLDHQLKNLGSRLIIRIGPASSALRELTDELGEIRIFAHEDFSHFALKRDEKVNANFNLFSLPGITIRHPTDILKTDGKPYTVFTPFKNKWYGAPLPVLENCLPVPRNLPPVPEGVQSENLPKTIQIPGFPATMQEGQNRLSRYSLDNIQNYHIQRNRLDLEGTSRLSPYLRFGLISAREAFALANLSMLMSNHDLTHEGIQTWMNELVWREFYTAILFHFPRVMKESFREAYNDIPWRDSPEDLLAWQSGETGYPIVDACLHQLIKTGWMHNRGRMIVASFLTKDLLINWQKGEEWFMANLIDGDPAANNGGWQWTAGTGTDAAPYFRIFNPVLQGKKFDPDGAFISKWLPKFQDLPVRFRHEPWKLSENEAEKYHFQLDRDYPHRIIDHSFARQRALHAYKSARNKSN